MSTLPPTHPASPRTALRPTDRQLTALTATLVALLIAAACWGLAAGDAHAQGPGSGTGKGSPAPTGRAPGGRLSDPVVREADLAAPAVVRIATLYTSHITLNFCGQTVTLPRSGDGYTEGVLGSGAFVSAHGDILTADHVVNVDHDTLEQQLLADPAAQNDIASALNSSTCFGFGPAIAAGDIANGFLQTSGIDFQTTFVTPRSYVWRDTWYSGAMAPDKTDSADLLKSLMSAPHDEATIVATSDFAHDDLAALRINAQNTPSIRLDDSATVQPLDTLTVIGFPGNGDANNDPTNLLTPSFNLASVSAVKTNTDGSALIQVGGNIEHGDSGGPALDANGRIVGIVSFGGPDNQGITAFLRSSDSAQRLMAGAKVNTQPGAFEQAWERAFNDYAATYPGHWRRSSQEFAALLKAYPQFKGAQPYATWAHSAAQHERLPDSAPTLSLIEKIVLAALAALALALIALTLFRAARGDPPHGSRRRIRYQAPALGEQSAGGLLGGALDERLAPSHHGMN